MFIYLIIIWIISIVIYKTGKNNLTKTKLSIKNKVL